MARPDRRRAATDDETGAAGGDSGGALRLDRWLHHARLFKTRTLAADRVEAGGVRLNGQPCRKPAQLVRPGDVLTVPTPGGLRSLRVRAPGARRGPPAEARGLYDDLDAPEGAAG